MTRKEDSGLNERTIIFVGGARSVINDQIANDNRLKFRRVFDNL